MGLRVRLHSRARADLRSIRDYLIEHAGKRSADRVRAHLMQRIAQLAQLSRSGKVTTESGVRILAPTRYPYRIYYLSSADRSWFFTSATPRAKRPMT